MASGLKSSLTRMVSCRFEFGSGEDVEGVNVEGPSPRLSTLGSIRVVLGLGLMLVDVDSMCFVFEVGESIILVAAPSSVVATASPFLVINALCLFATF